MSATKKISQETFDEVVEENIVDFEMSKEEALADTIKQFQSQGVDLSCLDTSGGIGRQELLDHIKTLEAYVQLDKDTIHQQESIDNVVNAMNSLCTMCAKLNGTASNEYALRNQTMMKTNGGLAALQNLLKVKCINTTVYTEDPAIAGTSYPLSDAVYAAAIQLQTAVMKTNVENRDFFEPWGSVLFVELVSYFTEQYRANPTGADADRSLQLLLDAYKCCRLASKTEYNKATLMKKGLDSHISQWLAFMVASTSAGPGETIFARSPLAEQTPESRRLLSDVTTEVCFMLRSLTVHDDDRKDMSCAYENGKQFMASSTSNDLLALARLFYCATTEAGSNIATAALLAAKQLITSEESVQIMSKHGAMELPLDIFTLYLTNNEANGKGPGSAAPATVDVDAEGAGEEAARNNLITVQLLRATAGVMRNLCADDVRKNALVKDGTMRALLCVLNTPECLKDLNFVEQAVGCLAMITLRAPHNAVAIINAGCGTTDSVLKAMYYHMNKRRIAAAGRARPPVQGNPAAFLRQGCLFFRNVAARCPDQREELLKNTNVEQVLKQVGLQYSSCVDEAYGALRDFQVEIKRVVVNAQDGSTSALYDTFGEGTKKSGFNPVFENSNAMDGDAMQARIADESTAPFAGDASNHVHGADCNH